jgi:hypothetical protein
LKTLALNVNEKIDASKNSLTAWVQQNVAQPTQQAFTNTKNYIINLPSILSSTAKDFAKTYIPQGSEWLYQNITLPIETFAQNHPILANVDAYRINTFLVFEKLRMSYFTDTNPETMTWTDLGEVWLYEYGNKDKIVFGPNAETTKEVMSLNGVQELRQEILDGIQNGNPEYSKSKAVEYGVDQYGNSLLKAYQGQSAELFLGSYTVSVNVESKGNDVYILRYEVTNPSTWASATRFREDNNKDGSHDSIIPDESPRGEGIELGGKLEEVFTWSEEIHLSTGNAK